ncbi:DUF4019 domain-containing protein [Nitrosomonas ureae]|uniref:DUF4019 domain-containing protein n=1 Tax=Nitrosomonas ureae TaxID=44577 RepID=A0A1H2HX97_9PROT|nr:DUF4019 domain-containing protein [Nitrosomonas ureae]ALQ50475.1 hypothetical protein ATY38_04025 [Nitrosomonas ureae]SDU36511.1 Protein of unknown function [Nitrosomonas ureae]
MYYNFFYRIFLVFLLIVPSVTLADEAGDAKSSAAKINDLVAEGKYSIIYDSYTSKWYQKRVTKDGFVSNLTLGRQMLGKRKSKALIDQGYATNDPTGYEGAIYGFTYKNTYTSVSLYEKIVVINEDGKGFKLAGFFAQPAE